LEELTVLRGSASAEEQAEHGQVERIHGRLGQEQ